MAETAQIGRAHVPVRGAETHGGGAAAWQAGAAASHDLAQRRQADLARAQLAAIVDSSSDAIIGKTLDGVITSWNAGAERIYGYTAAEMIGRPISPLVPPDRPDELPTIMERLRQGLPVEPFETDRVRKDGRRIHVSLAISPVKQPDGTIVGASAIARDITERKWTEALLAGERQVLELVARGTPLAEVLDTLTRMIEGLAGEGLLASILLVDDDGAHLRHGAAPSLPAAYNHAIDGVAIGPRAGSCGTAAFRCEPVIAGDIATDPLWDAFRDLALPHGLRACWSTPIVGSDGRVLGTFALYYPRPRLPSGEHLRLAALVSRTAALVIERCRVDEALRQSEARFRDLFEHAPVGYQELDAQGRFVRVNRALCEMLGYGPEELLGYPIWDFDWAHGEPAEETRRKFFDKLAQAAPWHGVERVRVRKDGTLRTVWVEDRLVHDAAGRIAGLRSAQLDITERKRAEEERARLYEAERAARAEAEAAVQARDAMAATVTHDLKNPLAAIRGWAQLLRRRIERGEPPVTGQLLEALGTIEGTAKRMANLLDDLLDVARLQAGRSLDLRRRPTDLVALARQAVQEQQQATEKHVIRLDAAAPSLVGTWDGHRLERVLANLLSNAVKFSPRGGEVTVAVHEHAGVAVAAVRDTGIGIPAPDLPHVFDRFRRARNVAGRIAGTGLGLAGAREIVALHGGTIAVESVEGAGTTVTVRLPLAPPPPASASA